MRTVLVADPNQTFATVVADALERLGGFEVVLATTGPEALQKSTTLKPHAAVIDGALPECRVADLITQMRRGRPDLPVVLMPVNTADVPQDIPVQGVLTKPFFLPDLPALITQLLGPDPEPAPLPRKPGTGNLKGTGSLKPRNTRLAVAGTLGVAPLRARLNQTGMLPPTPLTFNDELRRQVEGRVEAMSRALRDDPVFLTYGEKVLVIVPRLSPSATAALVQVVARAWEAQASAPEVIRFEGDSETNRYMLYSIRVGEHLALSVAVRVRIPLLIIRRVARETAAELAKIIWRKPGNNNQ